MGLFSKKSSSKIPAPDNGPPNGGYGGGYAQTQTPYGQPKPQSGGAGYRGPPGAGAGLGPGPAAGYNGYGSYGGNNGQPYGGDRFANTKAPSNNFGSGYDQMMGSGPKSKNLARNIATQPPTDYDLEAEYGQGSGPSQSSGRAGYDGLEQHEAQRDEEDDEVEAVKQQLRFTKQESLSSTRNALRIAREAEETATNTMLKLGDQSEKIGNTERHLDMAKAHASRAEDNAREIQALNRSIFRPNFQTNKQARRDAAEARIVARHIEEREERDSVRQDVVEAQDRVQSSMDPRGGADRFGFDRFGPAKSKDGKQNKVAARSRYQFETTESDEELEDELDANLDEINELTSRLNQLGKSMGQEVDSQNARLKRIGDKATVLDTKIFAGTQRLGSLK